LQAKHIKQHGKTNKAVAAYAPLGQRGG